MRKILFFLLFLLVGIGLFIWVVRIVGWQEIKSAIQAVSYWQMILIFGLTFLMIVIGNWRWKEILNSQGYRLSLFSLLYLYMAGFFITYLFPMILFGGEIIRGYALKKKFSLAGDKVMASVIIDRIFEWTIYLLVIFIGAPYFILRIGLPPLNLAIALVGTSAVFTTGIVFFYFRGFKKESIVKFILKLFNHKLESDEPLEVEKEIFEFLKPNKGFFWKVVGLSFLKAAVNLTRVWLLIIFLGGAVKFLPVLSVLGFTFLAMLIPVPAVIGTHEAIQVFAFEQLGIGGAGAGTAFTMIIRGAEIFLALLGFLFLLRLGFKLFETVLVEKIQKVLRIV